MDIHTVIMFNKVNCEQENKIFLCVFSAPDASGLELFMENDNPTIPSQTTDRIIPIHPSIPVIPRNPIIPSNPIIARNSI